MQLVVTEAHDSFNGTLLGDTMYIGADTLNSGEWAKTLIHEYTHFSEGTAEYQKLMDALTGDTKLTQKTLSELFDKSGYGFDKVKTEQILDKYGRLVNSETPATDIDSREEIRYNRKAKYISYDKIGPDAVNQIRSELRNLYQGLDGCVADGIAIEQDGYVYIVDSGKENGKIDFGVRERRKISDKNFRAEFIRRANNDAVSKRYASDELSSRIRDGLGRNFSSSVRRESGAELQADNGKPEDNQSRVLGENADNRRLNSDKNSSGEIKYNLKDNFVEGIEGSQEADADTISTELENEVAEELTEEELEYISEYKSELGAHLTANLLGNESFIDRITRENTTVAEKILNKISDMKERFARRGNPEAIAEYKKIKKAEKLYLDAVEKAGYAYVGRKIIGSISEREEKAKFSFAGVKAKNADKLKLSTAEQMLKSGIDSETVRRETGWFKGYDGKWRFEIDDSRMFFSKNGFNPDVLSYKKLELKFIMGTITVEEQKRLKELSETVKGIHLHRLDQFVKHDALFEAYPELKSIEVTFAELDSKEKGNYDYRNNEIQISNKLSPADIKETLVHEIQHAVQHIEDFANGSNIGMFDNTEENTAYEQYESTAGEVEARDVSNRLDYDADKRKNTRPDIERENVVFVDGVSVSKKIEKDGTGKTYWHIETAKDVFKGIKSVNGLQKAAYNFILRGDKGSKIADLIDGEKLEFIRISAGEYVYGSDSKTLTEAQYKQKMRMSTSIIDLIENAFVSYDAPDHKNHKMFPDGFKNYQGRVGIDETIFKYIVRVGKAKNGMIFYDICLEVDGKVPRANRTSLIKSSTSANSISQNSEKINTFSKKSSEDIKFNLKSRDNVTRSKGEDQKFKANYTKEKVYTKKEISDKLLSAPYISTLPKGMQNEIVESAWYSLNTIESDTAIDRFIDGTYNRILRDLWQNSEEFQNLSSDEIHEVELKLQK